jgi:hypothetical protein
VRPRALAPATHRPCHPWALGVHRLLSHQLDGRLVGRVKD